ncbi:MAG: hypothetical protein IPN34_15580 [Planctomycetes bacterium]|nr:hypothetical protein [Planctomycetota bacterium]
MRSAMIAVAALHREGRTQRDTLVKLAAVTPLLVGAITFALLWNGSTSRDTVGASALCALLLGYAGIAPGLIAGERERGTLGFLARTPRALRAAFGAKLLALVVAPLAIGAFGAVCAMAIRAAISAGAPSAFFGWTEGYAVLGLLVALWTLPLGALLRSGLVMPAGLLLAAALFVPLGLRLDAPRMGGVRIAAVGVVVAATVSGWLALQRSQRNGGRLLQSAACAALPLLVLVPGLHAWASAVASKNAGRSIPVPVADRTHLDEAYLGADGRSLYLNFIPLGAMRYISLVLDVQTGEVQREEEGSYYSNLGVFDGTQMISGSFGRHSLLVHSRSEERTNTVFETRSGAILGERASGRRNSIDPELDGWMRRAKRETTPWRDEHGHRLWFHGGRGEIETAEGEIEVREAPQDARFVAIGSNIRRSTGDSKLRMWDHLRWREIPKMEPSRRYLGTLLSGWLTQTTGAWEIIDPEAGVSKLSISREATDEDSVVSVLPLREGLALISTHDWETGNGRRWLLDPKQSALRALAVRGVDAQRIRGVDHGGYFFCEARDERDRLLLIVHLERAMRLARLDVNAASLEVLSCVESQTGESPLFAIATVGPDEVLVLTERRILRASFATDRSTVLYEVDQP